MEMLNSFATALEVFGLGLNGAWESLFRVNMPWFFNMTLGDVIYAFIGVSMFGIVVKDILNNGVPKAKVKKGNVKK